MSLKPSRNCHQVGVCKMKLVCLSYCYGNYTNDVYFDVTLPQKYKERVQRDSKPVTFALSVNFLYQKRKTFQR